MKPKENEIRTRRGFKNSRAAGNCTLINELADKFSPVDLAFRLVNDRKTHKFTVSVMNESATRAS